MDEKSKILDYEYSELKEVGVKADKSPSDGSDAEVKKYSIHPNL